MKQEYIASLECGIRFFYEYRMVSHLLTKAREAGFPVTALIKMHVGFVCGIAIRADYCHEHFATCIMHRAPEGFFLVRTLPSACQFGLGAIGKFKKHDVERIGEGVLGNTPR